MGGGQIIVTFSTSFCGIMVRWLYEFDLGQGMTELKGTDGDLAEV